MNSILFRPENLDEIHTCRSGPLNTRPGRAARRPDAPGGPANVNDEIADLANAPGSTRRA